MRVELKEYKFRIDKDFFIFIWNFGRIGNMKKMGLFRKRFLKNFIKHIFGGKKRKKSYLFKIISDDKLVGGVELSQVKGNKFNIGLSIFKKYRNKGIAKKTIKKLFVIAKRKGAKTIVGINDVNNKTSINLVKSLGYKKIKETKKEIFWEKKL